MNRRIYSALVLATSVFGLLIASARLSADTGFCSGISTTIPFTDTAASPFFCQIAEAFVSGLTNGTTATTYSPADGVPREQMAAFITRTQDSALRRGSQHAVLGQWAMPPDLPMTGRTAVGLDPALLAADGADIWIADHTSGDVRRIRASDGKLLGTWTGASSAYGVLVAGNRIFVTGDTNPGQLYEIDPRDAPGPVAIVNTTLGNGARSITTDGSYLWTANPGGGSISKISPGMISGTTNVPGFNQPSGLIFDGANLWLTDQADNVLKKLDSNGAVLQSVPVGASPQFPEFDGANIWVPNFNGASITVVRARDGMVLATLSGNGLNFPVQAAFDGERILVTNLFGNAVSIWKAADLTPIGFSSSPGSGPFGVCSDGANFWISLKGTNQLARF